MKPMTPVNGRQVRGDRITRDTHVRQVVLTICAIPFVVLVVAGAPLWGWVIAVACGLIVVCAAEFLLRRKQAEATARR